MGLWNYCVVCGERIETGQPCIGVKEESKRLCGDSICLNCAKIENLPEGEKPASITDLLARAEAADGRCKEEKHNTEYWEKTAKNWESNWNSELELRKAAEARAEQAERERDAAVEDLRQMCVGGNTCAFCKYGRGCGKQGPGRKTVEPCWEWRGQKEE